MKDLQEKKPVENFNLKSTMAADQKKSTGNLAVRSSSGKKGLGIQAKLLVALIPIIIVVIGGIVIAVQSVTSKILLEKGNSLLEANTNSVVSMVQAWMNSVTSTLDAERDTLEYMAMTPEEELAYIRHTAGVNSAIPDGIYYGTTSGGFLHGSWVPDAGFDPRERAWYQAGLNSNSFVFGSPYLDANTGKNVIFAAAALHYKNGGTRGVAAADIQLTTISDIVKQVQIEQTGGTLLVDSSTGMLDARKQDHVNWVSALERSIETSERFTLATDPHKCNLGKWYDNFKTNSSELSAHLARLEEPHRKLHEVALRAERCIEARDRDAVADCKKSVFEEARDEYMPRVLDVLESAKEIFRAREFQEMVLVLSGDTGLGMPVFVNTILCPFFPHSSAADGFKGSLKRVKHLLPGRHRTAHRLHRQGQNPRPLRGQTVRQKLVAQHSGVERCAFRAVYRGKNTPGRRFPRPALVGYAKLRTELRHPLSGAVVGDDHEPDTRIPQRRDIILKRPVGMPGGFCRQSKIQIAQQQRHPQVPQKGGRYSGIIVKNPVRHQGKRHNRSPFFIAFYEFILAYLLVYQFSSMQTRGGLTCRSI